MQKKAVEDVYRVIGERVRELRRLRVPRISQQALASAVGLSRASVANIEHGRHRIQVHVLCDLARSLGVGPEQLLPSSSSETALPPTFVRSLKPKERAAVARMLKAEGDSDA